jgi:hypothetical protein
VVVNAAGTLFVADVFNAQVLEVSPLGGKPTVLANGTGELALDKAGNVYFASGKQVLKWNRSEAPVFLYADTSVGATSSAVSVSIVNSGNVLLTLADLSVGPNFSQATGSGTPLDCAASTSLVPGARCNLSIKFAPTTADSLESAATLTDNAGNGNPASQSITLVGSSQTP